MEDETAFMTIDDNVTTETIRKDIDKNLQEDSIIRIDEETDFIRLNSNVPSKAPEDIDSKSKEDSLHIFMNQETAFVTIDAKDTLETIQDDIEQRHASTLDPRPR